MHRPERPFLGITAEVRIADRRQALLDRAFELISANEWTVSSISQICRDVGLNKRYFYESFSSLEDLENTLIDDLTKSLMAVGIGCLNALDLETTPTETLATEVLSACVRWLDEDRRRITVLFCNTQASHNTRNHRDWIVDQLAATLAEFGLDYHQPDQAKVTVTHAHRQIAKLGAALMIGGTIEALINWSDGKLDMTQDEFTHYIARFWVDLGATAAHLANGTPSENAHEAV